MAGVLKLVCCVLGVAGWMLSRALSYIATCNAIFMILALLPLPPGWLLVRAALRLGQTMLDIFFYFCFAHSHLVQG